MKFVKLPNPPLPLPNTIVMVMLMKLSTAIGRFDAQLRADGRSPHTRAVYIRDLRSLKKWLGERANVEMIRPQHLTRYLTSKTFTHMDNGRPRATITLNRMKSALRIFFQFLLDAGYIKDNPARLVRLSKSSRKPPPWSHQLTIHVAIV